MKRKSILDRQSVKRRSPKETSRFWRGIRLVSSLSFKILLLLTGMISISLLFLYLYQYLITSPYIKLEQVVITGVDKELKRDIIRMAGLSTDMSLLTINLDKIRRTVEMHPWVRKAELEKKFPHTLMIRVEKEVPRALVAFDTLAYMNRWGKIFKEVEGDEDKDFPVITGVSKNDQDRSERLKLAAGILDLFESETGVLSLKEISEIHFSEDGDVSFYSAGLPVMVRMGDKGLAVKKKELAQLIKHLQKTGRAHRVKAIDMNYPDGAVVSFKEGEHG
jgi:cell division protein FtsQ